MSDEKKNGADNNRAVAELLGIDVRHLRALVVICAAVGYGAANIVEGYKAGAGATNTHDHAVLDARLAEIGRRLTSVEADRRHHQANFRQVEKATIQHMQDTSRRLSQLEYKATEAAGRIEVIEGELKARHAD